MRIRETLKKRKRMLRSAVESPRRRFFSANPIARHRGRIRRPISKSGGSCGRGRPTSRNGTKCQTVWKKNLHRTIGNNVIDLLSICHRSVIHLSSICHLSVIHLSSICHRSKRSDLISSKRKFRGCATRRLNGKKCLKSLNIFESLKKSGDLIRIGNYLVPFGIWHHLAFGADIRMPLALNRFSWKY